MIFQHHQRPLQRPQDGDVCSFLPTLVIARPSPKISKMQLTHPGVQPFLPLSRAHGSDECRSLPYPEPRLTIRWTRGPEGHDALVIRWRLHMSE